MLYLFKKKKSIFFATAIIDTVSKFYRIFVKNIDSELKNIFIRILCKQLKNNLLHFEFNKFAFK